MMNQAMNDEHVESNEQFVGMWSAFARRFPEGRVESSRGIAVAISGTPMSFVNVIAYTTPIQNRADLVERCLRARRIGAECGVPWLLATCDAWMGDLDVANEVLREMGLSTVLPTVGMVADSIKPSPKPMLEGIEFRRVVDEETRNALVDLNTISYGIPQDIGRKGPARACFWDDSFHGYVAYVNGEPVAATVTAPLDGRLYVSWVATHPDHRRKRYADAVMRKSLESAREATGITRTVLHATAAGQPVYEAMGYRPVVGFTWYGAE